MLREYLCNHDGIWVHAHDDPPLMTLVSNPQLETLASNDRHRSGMGHCQRITPLQPSQQEADLDPGRWAEGRRLDLSRKPDEGLVVSEHSCQNMSHPTFTQAP